MSQECLTAIDHANLGNNKVFITFDMSDWHTGAALSVGTSWESAHPVAFDSMQLKGTEKNYPVHEKELLAIVHVLKKWQSDLLGIPFIVYTDHWTLQNFDTQHTWKLFISQAKTTLSLMHCPVYRTVLFPGKQWTLRCIPSSRNLHQLMLLSPSQQTLQFYKQYRMVI